MGTLAIAIRLLDADVGCTEVESMSLELSVVTIICALRRYVCVSVKTLRMAVVSTSRMSTSMTHNILQQWPGMLQTYSMCLVCDAAFRL